MKKKLKYALIFLTTGLWTTMSIPCIDVRAEGIEEIVSAQGTGDERSLNTGEATFGNNLYLHEGYDYDTNTYTFLSGYDTLEIEYTCEASNVGRLSAEIKYGTTVDGAKHAEGIYEVGCDIAGETGSIIYDLSGLGNVYICDITFQFNPKSYADPAGVNNLRVAVTDAKLTIGDGESMQTRTPDKVIEVNKAFTAVTSGEWMLGGYFGSLDDVAALRINCVAEADGEQGFLADYDGFFLKLQASCDDIEMKDASSLFLALDKRLNPEDEDDDIMITVRNYDSIGTIYLDTIEFYYLEGSSATGEANNFDASSVAAERESEPETPITNSNPATDDDTNRSLTVPIILAGAVVLGTFAAIILIIKRKRT